MVCFLVFDTVLTSLDGDVFYFTPCCVVLANVLLLLSVAVTVVASGLLCGLFCLFLFCSVRLLESKLSSSTISCCVAVLAVGVGEGVVFLAGLLLLVLVTTPKYSTLIMTSAPSSFLANSCQVAHFFLFFLGLQLLYASVWLAPGGLLADLLTVVELLVVGN